jgi:hypothetical protein
MSEDKPKEKKFTPFGKLLWWLITGSLILPALTACENSSSKDESDFEIQCLEWQHKTPQQKYLDGPTTRDACQRYLQNRTEKKIEKDQEFERWMIEQARKEWDAYEKKNSNH